MKLIALLTLLPYLPGTSEIIVLLYRRKLVAWTMQIYDVVYDKCIDTQYLIIHVSVVSMLWHSVLGPLDSIRYINMVTISYFDNQDCLGVSARERYCRIVNWNRMHILHSWLVCNLSTRNQPAVQLVLQRDYKKKGSCFIFRLVILLCNQQV